MLEILTNGQDKLEKLEGNPKNQILITEGTLYNLILFNSQF